MSTETNASPAPSEPAQEAATPSEQAITIAVNEGSGRFPLGSRVQSILDKLTAATLRADKAEKERENERVEMEELFHITGLDLPDEGLSCRQLAETLIEIVQDKLRTKLANAEKERDDAIGCCNKALEALTAEVKRRNDAERIHSERGAQIATLKENHRESFKGWCEAAREYKLQIDTIKKERDDAKKEIDRLKFSVVNMQAVQDRTGAELKEAREIAKKYEDRYFSAHADLATAQRERDDAVNRLVAKSLFKSDSHIHAEMEHDSLRAQLAAAEERGAEDKAMLDWLEKWLALGRFVSEPTDQSPGWELGYNGGPAYVICGNGDTLRSAILAAMKSDEKP